MSDFKAKMYQIQFRLGLCPSSCWGSLQHSPDPLAGFKGPTSKGREGMGKKGMGKEGDEKVRGSLGEGRGRDPTPSRPLIHISGYAPSMKPLTVFFVIHSRGHS